MKLYIFFIGMSFVSSVYVMEPLEFYNIEPGEYCIKTYNMMNYLSISTNGTITADLSHIGDVFTVSRTMNGIWNLEGVTSSKSSFPIYKINVQTYGNAEINSVNSAQKMMLGLTKKDLRPKFDSFLLYYSFDTDFCYIFGYNYDSMQLHDPNNRMKYEDKVYAVYTATKTLEILISPIVRSRPITDSMFNFTKALDGQCPMDVTTENYRNGLTTVTTVLLKKIVKSVASRSIMKTGKYTTHTTKVNSSTLETNEKHSSMGPSTLYSTVQGGNNTATWMRPLCKVKRIF